MLSTSTTDVIGATDISGKTSTPGTTAKIGTTGTIGTMGATGTTDTENTVIINISKYKLELLSDIYKNPKIVSAIDSQQTDVTPSEPDTLMYQNLFPYMRIPATQNIADTYILLSVDLERVNRNNQTYARYHTTFWVLAALDRMQMEEQYKATRIDYIAEEIARMFHGSNKFGFSTFELVSNREILLDVKYLYRELVFVCNDLRQPVTMG